MLVDVDEARRDERAAEIDADHIRACFQAMADAGDAPVFPYENVAFSACRGFTGDAAATQEKCTAGAAMTGSENRMHRVTPFRSAWPIPSGPFDLYGD
jgi:hypothetical protein